MALSYQSRFNLSELPLAKSQRSDIDSLLARYKKNGGYDALRKSMWKSMNTDSYIEELTKSIEEVAELEIEKNPALLGRKRETAATLIQGALERSGVFAKELARIDEQLSPSLPDVLLQLRRLRADDVGEAKAHEEEVRGSKTDDQYEAETDARANDRQARRDKLDQVTRETAALKMKIRMMEEKKAKEEQARKAEEERKRVEAQKEARRVERKKRKEEEEARELERIKLRDERARLREEERKQREVEYEKERLERERRRKERVSREGSRDTRRDSVDPRKEPLTEKDLEAAALESLLNEGKEHAKRSSVRKEYDYDRDERKSRKRDRSADSPRREERRSRSRDRKSRTHDTPMIDAGPEIEEGEAETTPSPVVQRATRRPRSASPLGIDRYVPGGGTHRSLKERERDRAAKPERERERSPERTKTAVEQRYESYKGSTARKVDGYAGKETETRERRRDSYREPEKERPRERERDRDRDRDERDKDRDRRRSRSPRRRDERDDRRSEYRDDRRDRDRDREKDRDRDRDRDYDRRDKDRDRELSRRHHDGYKPSSHRESRDEYRSRDDRDRSDRYRESSRRDRSREKDDRHSSKR